MKRTFRWTSLFLVLALMVAGSALAYDEGFHVKKAADNKGDMIIFPAFVAAGGIQTKLTVINTHPVYSVVAKVVYRSHYWTTELLDHLIYLSPRDVWTGIIRVKNGNVQIYSEDDSMLSASGVWADEVPAEKNFYTANLCSNDSTDRGYVEVMEVWWGDTRNYAGCAAYSGRVAGLDVVPPQVDKDALLALYPPAGSPAAAFAGLQTNCTDDADTIDHTINVMTGFFEFQWPAIPSFNAAQEALVFADFDLTQYMNVAVGSGLDAYAGRNTLGELEAAISKNRIAMPYTNESGKLTLHFFNFPTKLDTDCTWGGNNGPKGPFWQQHGLQCLTYTRPFFDLSENELSEDPLYSGGTVDIDQMCEELQFLSAPTYFEEGWAEYVFAPTQAYTEFNIGLYPTDPPEFTFTGVPVNPLVVTYIPQTASSTTGLNMYYPAWDEGMVYGALYADGVMPDNTLLFDYQSFNVMDAMGMNLTTGFNNSGALNTYPEAATAQGPPYFGIDSATSPYNGNPPNRP